MNRSPLIQNDEAQAYIAGIADPITRNLVNMAYVLAVKKCCVQKSDCPKGEFDMAFYVRLLEELLSEHDVIERTLAGEKVGAWFDE